MYFKAVQQEGGYDYFKMCVSSSRQVIIVRRQYDNYSYVHHSSDSFSWINWSDSTKEESLDAFKLCVNDLIDEVDV